MSDSSRIGDVRENWFLSSVDFGRSISVYKVRTVFGVERLIAQAEFRLEPEPKGFGVVTPTFTLAHEEAQEWINKLWDLGFRPNNGNSSTAHVSAMDAHIQTLSKSHDALIEMALRK